MIGCLQRELDCNWYQMNLLLAISSLVISQGVSTPMPFSVAYLHVETEAACKQLVNIPWDNDDK